MPAGNDHRAVHLVRHAFAGEADPAQWPNDADRPLTVDGAARFRDAARGLRRLIPDVDAVLSSGYLRTWQTAQLLHEVAVWPEPEDCPALEADQPPRAAVEVLRGRPERSIALVGHDPHLSRLASLLCTGEENTLQLELKKGAAASLSFEESVEPARARLLWAVPPRVLRKL